MSTSITGAAGEHYAMYKLLQRGWLAALTPTGAPGVDILVSDRDGSRLAAIQVKTAGSPVTYGWQLSKKHEEMTSPTLFYCFISPNADQRDAPACWIVPSIVVAEHVRVTHLVWLDGVPKRGKQRQDGDKRKMHLSCEPLDRYPLGWMDQYQEAWSLLEVDVT